MNCIHFAPEFDQICAFFTSIKDFSIDKVKPYISTVLVNYQDAMSGRR